MYFHSFNHSCVVWFGQFDPREEVRGYARKQGQILRQELGHIDVIDRPEHQHFFVVIRVLQFQVACCRQNRLNSPHTVVVVMLTRQLFSSGDVNNLEKL